MRESLERILTRDGVQPSLLGWVAANSAATHLPSVARVAISASELAPHSGWPVVGEAVQEVCAARGMGGAEWLAELPRAPDSLASALARLGESHRTPLAELTDQQVAYLLPFIAAEPWPDTDSAAGLTEARARSMAALRTAIRAESGWYATALAARVVPHLAESDRGRIGESAHRLGGRWGARLGELLRRSTAGLSPTAELALSHPALGDADVAAAALDTATVAEICRRVTERLGERYREPTPLEWTPPFHPADYHDSGYPVPGGELLGPLSEDAPERRLHYISTGLAESAQPTGALGTGRCLRPGTTYLFWLEIGDSMVDGSIERHPEPLDLPSGELTVALYGFPGQIEVFDGQDTGRLELLPDGRTEVLARPAGMPAMGSRLFLPIRTPADPGTYRLRCHVYYRQTLLQSRLVEIQVEHRAPARPHAISALIDYTSGIIPHPRELAEVRPLTLSVFVNGNGDGTHSLRFMGEEQLKAEAVLDHHHLVNMIEETRGALRRAAWGDTEPGDPGFSYRYQHGAPRDHAEDLIDLACKGYRLWAAIGGEFATSAARAGNGSPMARLAARLRRPGVIEIASKDHAGLVVPAALIYDHPLDWGGPQGLGVCDAFLGALAAGSDLAESSCLLGDCPAYGDDSVVCPSGFWGFRHEIGLPQSTSPASDEELSDSAGGGHRIQYSDRPRCVVGISQEFAGEHTERVGSAYRGPVLASREALLTRLRESEVPQLLYFFCHGEVNNGNPMLRVGGPASEPISWEHVADGRMYWPESRPLVFLNGCRTAAVEPLHAMTFVKAFVHRARASGMIGTEIITFESLAADFADSMLDHFMERGTSIAHAMRAARLALLSQLNPLGLIYVAYAPPHLRMARV